MSDKEISIPISMPVDDDGYVLLKCPLCGEKFMISVADIKDESQLEIWCPKCGIASNSYVTDELMDRAYKITENYAKELLNGFQEKMVKKFKGNSCFEIKGGKKFKKEVVDPIIPEINNLSKKYYCCCKKTAKVDELNQLTGGYCPFCGEINNGN
jgi:predicted RNA-binding Zn-ribbon protein involved in translation (DUF1610 family)